MEKFLDDFAKIPQKQKLGGLVVLVVAMLGLYYTMIYDDQSIKLDTQTQEAKRLEAELVEKQAIAENLDKYKVEVKRLEGELEKAKALLPDEGEVPALLSRIDDLGTKSGLEISRFEPQREEMKDFYARLPFKLKVTGNYHEIATFIDTVGKLERIVNVENISMREPKMLSKKYLVGGEFVVTTYRFVDKGGGEAPAGEPPP
ncbi:MAG: type 4a pilus biogenesis protein PilO [Deltaproteobacteria bacterium]|nr:type 4a pilus biogenesis protein PilO [Deltaproteobacteria bacterium]